MNSFESHSMNWSELAMINGWSLFINSLANKVVQAAPSVIPSTSTIVQLGDTKFNNVSKLYFSLCDFCTIYIKLASKFKFSLTTLIIGSPLTSINGFGNV